MPTENFNLPLLSDNMANDVVRDMNALAEATDGALKGLGDSKADSVELTTLNNKVTQHLEERATADKLGHVKLPEPLWSAVLQNGWAGSIKYGKDDFGKVTLRFAAYGGTVSPLTVIATLPIGYRPSVMITVPVNYDNVTIDQKDWYITIDTTGEIRVGRTSGIQSGFMVQNEISYTTY